MPSVLDSPTVLAFDEAVDKVFDNGRGNAVVDRVFYAASEAANHSILWHVLTWVPVFVGKREVRTAVKISAALGIESALINGPVKMVFRRERPVVDTERPHQLRVPRTSSFPSGHATSGFCAATLLTANKRTKPAYFLLASVVASSRVHVKIHHASDVIAGTAIGLVFGRFLKKLLHI